MNDEVFLAYTAGFFDADGTVGVYAQKGAATYYLQVSIDQRERLPIFAEWQQRWGGGIYHTHVWHWKLYNQRAAPFLKDIVPYLRKKQAQATLALEFIHTKPDIPVGVNYPPERIEYEAIMSNTLKALKREGVGND